jgi:hypothetical protein
MTSEDAMKAIIDDAEKRGYGRSAVQVRTEQYIVKFINATE